MFHFCTLNESAKIQTFFNVTKKMFCCDVFFFGKSWLEPYSIVAIFMMIFSSLVRICAPVQSKSLAMTAKQSR